jgi:hypothetical protein
MHVARRALWVVRESGLPAVVKPCPDCSGTCHRPSGKFRVNANGKLLDVWLLLRCTMCGRTSKVPVYQRVRVRSLDRARLVAYQANDPAMVRELTMSESLAAKNGYRLDWAGTWELQADPPFCSLADPAPLTVLISFELPAPIRAERLLMLGLGISRAEVQRAVADGRIRLPVALGAKAYQDFEFIIDGAGSWRLCQALEAAPCPASVACRLVEPGGEEGRWRGLRGRISAMPPGRSRLLTAIMNRSAPR